MSPEDPSIRALVEELRRSPSPERIEEIAELGARAVPFLIEDIEAHPAQCQPAVEALRNCRRIDAAPALSTLCSIFHLVDPETFSWVMAAIGDLMPYRDPPGHWVEMSQFRGVASPSRRGTNLRMSLRAVLEPSPPALREEIDREFKRAVARCKLHILDPLEGIIAALAYEDTQGVDGGFVRALAAELLFFRADEADGALPDLARTLRRHDHPTVLLSTNIRYEQNSRRAIPVHYSNCGEIHEMAAAAILRIDPRHESAVMAYACAATLAGQDKSRVILDGMHPSDPDAIEWLVYYVAFPAYEDTKDRALDVLGLFDLGSPAARRVLQRLARGEEAELAAAAREVIETLAG